MAESEPQASTMSTEPESWEHAVELRKLEALIDQQRRDYELRKEELTQKRLELDRTERGKFTAAATAAIAAAFSLLSAASTAYLSKVSSVDTQTARSTGELDAQRIRSEADVESVRRRTEADIQTQRDKSQTELRAKELDRSFQLMLKATENRNPADAAQNLLFFVDIGYLPDPDGKIRKKAKERKAPVFVSEAIDIQQFQTSRTADLLDGYVFPDGKLNQENHSRLEAFMQSKGIKTSVVMFINGAGFWREREEAVRTLNLAGSRK